MSQVTRSKSSKAASETSEVSDFEGECMIRRMEEKQRVMREQAEALQAQQEEFNRKKLEFEKSQEQPIDIQSLGEILAQLQTEIRDLKENKSREQNLLEMRDRFPFQNLDTRSHTSSPTQEYSPIRLKDIADSIPKYDGQRMSVYQFSKQCERALELIPPRHETYLVQLIRSKLQGHAYTAVDGTEFHDVPSLLRHLKRIFGPNKSLNQYRGELGNAYMRTNENIFDYVARIKELRVAILDCETETQGPLMRRVISEIDKDVLESFINGLPSELLIRVKIEGFNDLDDAFIKAIQLSKTLETEALRRKPTFTPRPSPPPRRDFPVYKTAPGRDEKRAPDPPIQILERPRAPFIKPLVPGRPGPNSPPVCFSCNMPGHFAKDCRRNIYYKRNEQTRDYEKPSTSGSGNADRVPDTVGVRREAYQPGHQVQKVTFKEPAETKATTQE